MLSVVIVVIVLLICLLVVLLLTAVLLILLTAMFSCCLVSSMGIALPGVMLGIFALLFGLFQKNSRYLGKMLAGCLPCALYGILYIVLKSV